MQYNIISENAKYVQSGGYLVYSTCSVFPQENELIVKRFLSEHADFEPEPLLPNFLKFGINIPNLTKNDFYVSLYPFIHRTDGFFISKMKRM